MSAVHYYLLTPDELVNLTAHLAHACDRQNRHVTVSPVSGTIENGFRFRTRLTAEQIADLVIADRYKCDGKRETVLFTESDSRGSKTTYGTWGGDGFTYTAIG